MPGIIGLVDIQNSATIEQRLLTMVSACAYQDKYQKETFADKTSGVGFSRLHLGVFKHGNQPVFSKDKSVCILFDGELYDNNSGNPDPEFILDRYESFGDSCVKGIDGIYAFVIFDARKKCLKLFSDHFGLKPVYYYKFSHSFLFASEVKALLPLYKGTKKRDDGTIADFFNFGFPVGDETLFQDIKLLPPASCLSYDLNSNTLSIQKYWELLSLFTPKGEHDPNLNIQEIVDAFVRAVDRRSGSLDRLGLSLSGGLDSRSIIAALGEKSKGLKTYTVGLANCQDEKLAKAMASAVECYHQFVQIDLEYLTHYRDIVNQFIFLTDGLFHPREGTEIASLNYFKTAPFRISLRGHGGELAKASLAHPVMVDEQLLSAKTEEEIIHWILSKGNHITPGLNVKKLFHSSFSDTNLEHPRNYLKKILSRPCELLDPGDVALYFYIDTMTRRFSVPSLDIFRTEIEIRMPYFDLDFLRALFRNPIRKRFGGEIQRGIVARCQPRLVKIVDSNTGAPLDAAAWQVYLHDKLNSVLKKLSVAGFRHYTEFAEWQRKYFANDLKKILFSDNFRDRQLYNLNFFYDIYEQHMTSKIDSAAFLGTAVGIELWHKQFFDK